jgi:hypothetical protein
MIKEIYDFLLMLDQTGVAYVIFILTAVYFWTKSNKATTELYAIKRELLKLKAVL